MCFSLGKRRRREGGFCGSEVIADQLSNGVDKKRIGITSHGAVLRQHCKIVDDKGSVGHITSGCPSPTMGCNVAMGYVPSHLGSVGTNIDAELRNRVITAKVTALPFVPCTYYKKS